MAATYATFFEKVAELMRDVATHFPKFVDAERFFATMKIQMPSRMQESIVGAYSILLLSFEEILLIFYKGSDRMFTSASELIFSLSFG
jgi:hypothetical protein